MQQFYMCTCMFAHDSCVNACAQVGTEPESCDALEKRQRGEKFTLEYIEQFQLVVGR